MMWLALKIAGLNKPEN